MIGPYNLYQGIVNTTCMEAVPSRRDQAQAKRQALIDAARKLFAADGYFETGTEEILHSAGVGTRGVMYHHFADKQALFEAVFHDVQRDLADIATRQVTGTDALEILASSMNGFLDAAADNREIQRILLIDAPAVLGWDRWRALEAAYGVDAIEAMLTSALENNLIEPQPLRSLAHLLLGLVDEAALYIANAADPGLARQQMTGHVDRLISGLRRQAS
jgi:AcrR family transcriptional regulator